MSAERNRIEENIHGISIWHRWGPYLSERQWGTVREDYSNHGNAWEDFTHEMSHYRAYQWGEDGLGGICNRHCSICFSFALWNGQDPLLKERLFGLNNPQGNHGEDVKEYYYYLDNTPTHSYMKYLYKYPHNEFPYKKIVEETRKRGAFNDEYELLDTGIFNDNQYFDVYIEYAKADPEDILIQATIHNRGTETASLTLLPQLWYRNTWSWKENSQKPELTLADQNTIKIESSRYGNYFLAYKNGEEFLFTDNETNLKKLKNFPNTSAFLKDGFQEYLINNNKSAVNPNNTGTKATRLFRLEIQPGNSTKVQLRLSKDLKQDPFGQEFDEIFTLRKKECAEFYEEITPGLSEEDRQIQTQAFSGLLWNKQFYYYPVRNWINSGNRVWTRNWYWKHFHSEEVLSMPDKWEYPWFASWDTAFHCIPLAMIDPMFAKEQLIVLLREWFMHPNGQIPAYEWEFEDVNPPVHAWAALRVYKIENRLTGKSDVKFLAQVFHKLLLNFTWWVNRKDSQGLNIFEGGFLGLDNIGVFDRNMKLPHGMRLEQSDATSWMAMYCLNMLSIALELAQHDRAYAHTASKFFEHFMYISGAINGLEERDFSLWDEEDGFYYDAIHLPDGSHEYMKIRSIVGLIPLLAVTTIEPEVFEQFPKFQKRVEWFLKNRPDLVKNIDFCLNLTYFQP